MSESVIKNNLNATKLLNFIKTQEEQYPVLDKEQERAMIKKYKNKRDILNRLLFMHNIRAVFNQAKKYMSKTEDFDAMVQDGMIGLAEACKRFDINRNIKFITYATVWIRKYILMRFYGKQYVLDKHTMSLNTIITSDKDGTESTFENFVNDCLDPVVEYKSISLELSSNEQRTICDDLINRMQSDTSLSSTEKNVFIDMFYNKEKTSDLMLKYNLEKEQISDIKTKILSKMRDTINDEYDIYEYDDIACY